MKAWVVSDLHHDYNEFLDLYPPKEADVAIVAGDVVNDDWLVTMSRIMPTIFVPGNHDFYKTNIHDRRRQLQDLAYRHPGLLLLDNSAALIYGVRFVGGTLWTDYNNRSDLSMFECQQRMNDHKKIRWSNDPFQRFLPKHALMEHSKTRRFIEHSLLLERDVKTVIVTHHAPSYKSIGPKYAGDKTNPAYASNLDDMIEEIGPDFWFHGHTHNSVDYLIGKTRVINNPLGYGDENKNFDPELIVEI
ncbi:metallo-phosphoesterase [Rhizobium phage RHph_N34]|uniref:Putative metallophosphoesterase protein n=1 Tax=Rhizobium phage RHph_N34 TaxID=2509586 RepID=A0A7S5UY48_9CAUD|nr:metallo-phosphoesterase [Rhizobium phage RHph_N34]QIG74028.1 putative metallophosphoesterase protein [Rhizobium phage RHph_N34]